jgi:hypothetical protein
MQTLCDAAVAKSSVICSNTKKIHPVDKDNKGVGGIWGGGGGGEEKFGDREAPIYLS